MTKSRAKPKLHNLLNNQLDTNLINIKIFFSYLIKIIKNKSKYLLLS